MSSSQGTGSPTPVVGLLARRLLAPTIAAIVTVVVASAFLALLPDGFHGTVVAIVLAHVFFNVAVVVRLCSTWP